MNEKRQKLNEAFFDTHKKKTTNHLHHQKYPKYFHQPRPHGPFSSGETYGRGDEVDFHRHHFHRSNLLRQHSIFLLGKIEDLFSRIGNFWNISRM